MKNAISFEFFVVLLSSNIALALSSTASANEIVASYTGTITTVYYDTGKPTSSVNDQHQVDFHYTRDSSGAIQADFYVTASFDGGTAYRVFFINSKVVDPAKGIYHMETWGNSNNGPKPQIKTGGATFIGAPGQWQSYTYDQGTATVNDPSLFVSGGSVFSKDDSGHEVMTEEDTYKDADGIINQKSHAVLVSQP